jgi:hypothetical protein
VDLHARLVLAGLESRSGYASARPNSNEHASDRQDGSSTASGRCKQRSTADMTITRRVPHLRCAVGSEIRRMGSELATVTAELSALDRPATTFVATGKDYRTREMGSNRLQNAGFGRTAAFASSYRAGSRIDHRFGHVGDARTPTGRRAIPSTTFASRPQYFSTSDVRPRL